MNKKMKITIEFDEEVDAGVKGWIERMVEKAKESLKIKKVEIKK